MKLTLSIDDDLAKRVRRIAADRNTTLPALVRGHLRELAAQHAKSAGRGNDLAALERSFEQLQFSIPKRNWKREDLRERQR
jgi:predicted transcriptional regulator